MATTKHKSKSEKQNIKKEETEKTSKKITKPKLADRSTWGKEQ